MGVDDNGQVFQPSADPLLDMLQPYVADIQLGADVDVHKHLQSILSNKQIFGFNLYEIGLGEKVEALFAQMIVDKGAVIATIDQALEDK